MKGKAAPVNFLYNKEQRVKKKISHENWLSDKEREEEQKMAAAKAEKAAKKLEEEKK